MAAADHIEQVAGYRRCRTFRPHAGWRSASMYRERAGAGDIVVVHDGDESAPFADQRHTVEATARLIPKLRAKGFVFETICDQSGPSSTAKRAPRRITGQMATRITHSPAAASLIAEARGAEQSASVKNAEAV